MLSAIITNRAQTLLPKLGLTAAVCWMLGANTHLESINTLPAPPSDEAVVYSSTDIPLSKDVTHSMQVLSANDARVYRTVFEAQQEQNWNKADRAMGWLDDRRLVGYVLADRYRQRSPTLKELQAWLAKYPDYPQAGDLYEQALLQADNNKPDEIPAPESADIWSGSDTYGSSLAFRVENIKTKMSPAEQKFGSQLNRALHHDNPAAAEKLLEAEQHHRAIPAPELARAQGLIAAIYFYGGQSAHARHLADASAAKQNPLGLWIAGLAAWKQNDIKASAAAFAKLAGQPGLSSWDSSAAQFWAWRALKRTGDAHAAHAWLEQAARQPHSFYGMMAANLLDHGHSWSWETPQLNRHHVALLGKEKAGWRALALLQIGKRDDAENELRHLNPQGHRGLQEAMLALASNQHMASLALQLGGIATKANGDLYDAALYPVPPWQPADGFQVDRALVYALMRRESQFDPLAVSSRGACGLMQVLPATAHQIGDDRGVLDNECTTRIMNPSVNIDIGQKYVRHLAAQPLIGDNLLLLLAAYNGGPNKVARWLHEAEDTLTHKKAGTARVDYEKEDPLLFVESLPVRQTHDYVQQVLVHYWVYRARLGETENSLGELAHSQWPRYTLPADAPPKSQRDALLLPIAGRKIVTASTN